MDKISICLQCGKKFKAWYNSPGKFCSNSCSAKFRESKRKIRVIKTCLNCGKEFSVRPKRDTAKWCSYACSFKVNGVPHGTFTGKHHTAKVRLKLSELHKGAGAPTWRGGVYKCPYPAAFNSNLKRAVRQRDNFKCQECGYTEKQLGYALSVHHIDYNKSNNGMDNLISLCRSCHSKTNYKTENWIKYYTGLLHQCGNK